MFLFYLQLCSIEKSCHNCLIRLSQNYLHHVLIKIALPAINRKQIVSFKLCDFVKKLQVYKDVNMDHF